MSDSDAASSRPEQAPSRFSTMLKGAVLAALFVVIGVLWLTLPVPTVDEIRSSVEGIGWWSGLAFVVGYGVLSLIPIPKSVVSIAAGLIWGFGLGVLFVTVASVIGATLAFIVGRLLGQDLVERLLGDHLSKVDERLSDHGLRAVIVLRLIPVLPFTLVNYCAGLTSVNRRDYALGTLIGMLPGTVVFVAIGAYGLSLGWPFFLAVAAAAVVGFVVFLLVRRHRNTVAKAEGVAATVEA